MTIRRTRRSASASTPSSSSFFYFFSSEVSVLAVLCSLLILFALGLIIASPLSLAANVEADNVNVAVELNASNLNNSNSDNNNGTRNPVKEDSFADMIDRALEKEFTESEDQNEGNSS